MYQNVRSYSASKICWNCNFNTEQTNELKKKLKSCQNDYEALHEERKSLKIQNDEFQNQIQIQEQLMSASQSYYNSRIQDLIKQNAQIAEQQRQMQIQFENQKREIERQLHQNQETVQKTQAKNKQLLQQEQLWKETIKEQESKLQQKESQIQIEKLQRTKLQQEIDKNKISGQQLIQQNKKLQSELLAQKMVAQQLEQEINQKQQEIEQQIEDMKKQQENQKEISQQLLEEQNQTAYLNQQLDDIKQQISQSQQDSQQAIPISVTEPPAEPFSWPFNLPAQQQYSASGSGTQILIYNVPHYITEKMLRNKFADIGPIKATELWKPQNIKHKTAIQQGMIDFEHQSDADQAIKLFNFTRFSPDKKDELNMTLMKKLRKLEKQEVDKNTVFFKGIQNEDDSKQFYNFLSVFGDVHSIMFNYGGPENEQEFLGYGKIQFRKVEAVNKLLESAEDGTIQFKNKPVVIEEYKKTTDKNQTMLYE